MNTKVLEDIGLTQGEIKVYISLLELGSSSAGNILEKAKIQNSVFHFCVNRLIEKGLVSYVKKNRFRFYTATNPENFLIYMKDKEKQIEELLPKLKEKQTFAKEKQGVELFEGIKGIMTLLNILIENTHKNDEFLFFSTEGETEEKTKEIQKFYEKYDAKRKEKALIVKGITNTNRKPLFKERKTLKMKYTNFPIPANTAICNNKMVLMSWGEKPTGILITSKQLVDLQKKFFKELWKKL
ncbi:MAG: helix-turn-helix domain-containing protein [Candidatus Woesearchaeota archaeon]|jgi:sugar-specific transcriptional regulator TrmB